MSEDETDTGGCACGAVRYRMSASPLFVHCCHCTWCQRESGSAFAVNALIEADRVQLLEGELVECHTPSASGKGQRIARCASCHVALWSHYAYGAIGERLRFVRVGTLDDPSRVPPDIHIFTASKAAWLPLPPDAPSSEGYYRAADHWPASSLARRKALFDAVTEDP